MSDENIEIGNNNVAEVYVLYYFFFKKILNKFSSLSKSKIDLLKDYPLIVYKGAIQYFSTFDEISTASQEIL